MIQALKCLAFTRNKFKCLPWLVTLSLWRLVRRFYWQTDCSGYFILYLFFLSSFPNCGTGLYSFLVSLLYPRILTALFCTLAFFVLQTSRFQLMVTIWVYSGVFFCLYGKLKQLHLQPWLPELFISFFHFFKRSVVWPFSFTCRISINTANEAKRGTPWEGQQSIAGTDSHPHSHSHLWES